MFRPQDVTIREAAVAGAAGEAVLPGVVQFREFLGNLVRYSVRVGDHVILVDDAHHAGGRVFRPDDDVALGLNTDQVRLLAD
jgi:iron(III) transport system ATP-binding protein